MNPVVPMNPINNLAAALVAAQAEFAAIPKTAENPFFRSKYADLATVVAHTQPILAKHGLAVSQFPTVANGEPALSTYLLHSSGQFLCDTMRLCAAKPDPQGQGAAITYARRFAYMAVLGLVADVDDDGTAGNRAAREKPMTAADKARADLLALCKRRNLDAHAVADRFIAEHDGLAINDADADTVTVFAKELADEHE